MSDYPEDLTAIHDKSAAKFNRLTKALASKGIPDFSIKLAKSLIYKQTLRQLKEASQRPQQTVHQSLLTNDAMGTEL